MEIALRKVAVGKRKSQSIITSIDDAVVDECMLPLNKSNGAAFIFDSLITLFGIDTKRSPFSLITSTGASL